MTTRDLIDRFGREEDAFLRTEFVAPVIRGSTVRVRIAGMVCELAVRNPRSGIMVLRPLSTREAEIVREATRAEARRYLDLFPRARFVTCYQAGDLWFGIPAATPTKSIRIEGVAPIVLARGLQLFQTVRVRFDGALFLQESTERPAEAAYLRDALVRSAEPGELDRKGLTEPEREAYARQLRIRQELEMSRDERRLRRALELAGAALRDYRETGDAFTVTWRVDGVEHTSIVSKGDLTVISSGICLSDRDRDFDLTSLVSVMRQAEEEGMLE